MTRLRTLGGVILICVLGALAPAAAHADGGWVTVHYTGTVDQAFIYQPKDPSVWQEALHFTWDERQVFHLEAPYKVAAEPAKVEVGGKFSATFAPPNSLRNCSFGFAPRPKAPSPMSVYWPGTRSVGAKATMPIIGTYIQAVAPTVVSDACTVHETGGAGASGTPPDPAIQYYAQAFMVDLAADLDGPTVTRKLPRRTFKSADGGFTTTIDATMTVENSARRPPDVDLSLPSGITAARQRAKLAALEALRDTMQRAIVPCGVDAVATALLAAPPIGTVIGGGMSALLTPLCLSYVKTIRDEADTVADPPRADFRTAAKIKPVRARPVRLPACAASTGTGSAGDVCRRFGSAAQKVLRTARETGAAANAIDITIARGTAALKAKDRAASALQDRTLTTLGRSFAARRRAETKAARSLAQLLRAAGLNVPLDAPAAASALGKLQARLVAGGTPAAKLTKALGGPPQVTAFDLLTALDG